MDVLGPFYPEGDTLCSWTSKPVGYFIHTIGGSKGPRASPRKARGQAVLNTDPDKMVTERDASPLPSPASCVEMSRGGASSGEDDAINAVMRQPTESAASNEPPIKRASPRSQGTTEPTSTDSRRDALVPLQSNGSASSEGEMAAKDQLATTATATEAQ